VDAFHNGRGPVAEMERPRIENGKSLLVSGLSDHYTFENIHGIPTQWQKFHVHLGRIARQVARITYVVSYNIDEKGEFDYLIGTVRPIRHSVQRESC
jgi:AraC family transcriptional regulator